MALLLLLFGGFWTQVMSNPESLPNTSMSLSTLHTEVPGTQVMSNSEGLQNTSMSLSVLHTEVPSISGVPRIPEALAVDSTVSTRPETVDPEGTTSIWSQTPHLTQYPPSPTPFGLSAGDIINTPVPEPATSREVSNKTLVELPEPTAVSSDPSATTANPVTGRAVSFTSQETSQGISVPPVTMTTSSKETSEPSVATTVSSKSSGPPVTESLGLSSEPHGLPTTIATSSVESSSAAGGTPVSNIKISTVSTPEPVTTRTPHQGSRGMLLVPMLVALLVVLALVALLLLWRRRQKRRTGALTLSGGGKRNGVVDAWAGPARVPDEEAATAAASGSGGNKGSAALEREGSGQRPTLTTFFSRRKSRQGSLVLEELKSGPAPDLKGEEEPLVGGEDEAVETPTSDGLEAKDGAAPQSM